MRQDTQSIVWLLAGAALVGWVAVATQPGSLDSEPWISARCRSMWGPYHEGDLLAAREIFTPPRNLDPAPKPGKGKGGPTRTISSTLLALMGKNVTWPPRERGSANDFIDAVNNRKSEL